MQSKETGTDTRTLHEISRSQTLPIQAQVRRMATEAEKKIKGLYVDWLFGKLNVSKYR